MSPPPLPLKSPGLAACLSFLIPGLGHLYQGRVFKGALYLVCIWGTFFFGQRLGDWKVVYLDWHPEQRTWAYVCQFWTGSVAVPAIFQSYFRDKSGLEWTLNGPVTSAFSGEIQGRGKLTGEVKLTPDRNEAGGEFTGTLATAKGDQKVSGQLTRVSIEPQVAPDPRRHLRGMFTGTGEDGSAIDSELWGSIPRSLVDWYGAPLEDKKTPGVKEPRDGRSMLEQAHAHLGARFELGVLYTMVAGLLNILCIYDALEGPAYASDEQEPAEPQPVPTPVAA